MEQNIGGIDRAIRMGVGFTLVATAIIGTFEHAVWGWIGAFPLASAIVRRCPAYTIFGINTYKGG